MASSASAEKTVPSTTATVLGYTALLPFVVGAAGVWLLPSHLHALLAVVLSSYAAVVISFLGGIHWGLAFGVGDAPGSLFAWGVIPALVAWPAALLGPGIGLLVQAAMLATCYGVDRAVYPRHHAAVWLPLRLRLTVVATLCCVAAAAGA